MHSHVRHLPLISPSKFKLYNSPPHKLSLLFSSAAVPPPCPTPSLPPDSSPTRTHSNLLTLCSSLKSLPQTRELHALAILQSLLPSSVSLSAALIQTYATLGGDPRTCRLLFESTAPFCKTAFLWNTLIRANSILGISDGFETYNRLVRSGVRPDDHTFPSLLKTCAEFSAVQKGREIHGAVVKLGLRSDSFVGNTLLLFYCRCGDLEDAWKLLDEMPEREVVAWNTMIGAFSVRGCNADAVSLFAGMKLEAGAMPNVVTLVSVLPVCAVLEDELMTSLIHGYVVTTGLGSYVTVSNAMIDAYAKCGDVKSCRQVFEETDGRNTVSWNSVITGFAHARCYNDALGMFRLMVNSGEKANGVTISSMLPVLVELGRFDAGREIHAFSIRLGLDSDLFIANSLIDMYAKSGRRTAASNVFHRMDAKNVVSWNAMIANLTQNSADLAAIELITEMQVHGVSPNAVTFTHLLPACARVGSVQSGKEIHGRSIRSGFASDLFLSNALTDMYAKCNCLDVARKVFDISHRDHVSYNALIVNYAQTENCGEESLSLFKEMKLIGMNHDVVSFVGAIAACANLSALRTGKEIHGHVVRKTFHTRLFIANSLLDLYMKCGRINLAERVFEHIIEKDSASWNTMILGYGMLGEFKKAINLFEHMKTQHSTPDSVSYIAVLSACSHGGFVEEGKRFLDEMETTTGVEPTTMHFACMIDLLGRAGLIQEAVELIKNLPLEPDAHIWAALLGASRVQGNIELAKWAAEHLFVLKPEHCGYYALLSNMLSEAGRWEEAKAVRERMKSRGVKKNPGFSWVQVKDQVHKFLVGSSIDRLDSRLSILESGLGGLGWEFFVAHDLFFLRLLLELLINRGPIVHLLIGLYDGNGLGPLGLGDYLESIRFCIGYGDSM